MMIIAIFALLRWTNSSLASRVETNIETNVQGVVDKIGGQGGGEEKEGGPTSAPINLVFPG